MRLSREEFAREALLVCQAFQATSLATADDDPTALTKWELIRAEQGNDGNLYLIHPKIIREIPSCVTKEYGAGEYEFEESLVEDIDSVIPDSDSREAEWKFSVVYSDTWMVYVLYFTVKFMDGSLFSRSQVLQLLGVHDHDESSSWDFVSYEEHPITREPSFFLHPCRTSDRLELLRKETTSPLLSWLAMILPSVGFRVPTVVYMEVRQWIAT